MRIVILGGAGNMGAEAVHDLVKFSRAKEIVIADRNVRGARRLAENYLNTMAKIVTALGLTRTRIIKQVLGRILKVLVPVFPTDKEKNYSGIRVDIKGTRLGVPVTVSYAAVDHMRRLTGIPLNIGANMMAENKITRFGVFGPEAENAVDSKLFLEELGQREITAAQRELR